MVTRTMNSKRFPKRKEDDCRQSGSSRRYNDMKLKAMDAFQRHTEKLGEAKTDPDMYEDKLTENQDQCKAEITLISRSLQIGSEVRCSNAKADVLK